MKPDIFKDDKLLLIIVENAPLCLTYDRLLGLQPLCQQIFTDNMKMSFVFLAQPNQFFYKFGIYTFVL